MDKINIYMINDDILMTFFILLFHSILHIIKKIKISDSLNC